MQGWMVHLDKILAGLTALASLGELAHLFQSEWIVFVLALATFVSEFFKPAVPVVYPAPPLGQTPPQPPGAKGAK